MLTNRQIHDIAEKGYEKRRGHNQRIGYSVRWERRKLDGSIMLAGRNGVYYDYAECDIAGYLNKRDAHRLAKLLVKDGYTGVRTYRVTDCNHRATDHDDVVFSANYEVPVTPTDHTPTLQHVMDYLSAQAMDRMQEFNYAHRTWYSNGYTTCLDVMAKYGSYSRMTIEGM